MSLALECLSLGCLLALCAVSFSLIYSVLRITNFALQAQISVAAYVCYYLHVHLGIGAATAILLAILLGGLFGVAQYFVVFRRMLGSPSESIVIASLGVSLIIEAIILLLAGSRTLSLGMSDDVVTLGTQRLYVRDIGLFSLLVISVPLLVLFLRRAPTD
ncbi:MAG: hypothetical protein IPP07_07950 [Holophagales bacterium]|nr:hypothetical protein [Holophagales bacterium]